MTDSPTRRTFLGTTAAGLAASSVSRAAQREPFPWRVLELWHSPDGPVWWTRNANILTWEAMLHIQPSSLLGKYIAQARQWGFNALSLATYVKPDSNPEAMLNFAAYLRKQGIRLVLSRRWSEFQRAPARDGQVPAGQERLSLRYCPYQRDVRAYWAQRVDRDFQLMPALGAYHVTAGARNGPWMCNCSECQRRSPRQRTLDAIQLMADLLEKHNAPLFWEACQDDPWLMRLETDLYRDLTGKVPTNTLVLLKDCYWDFHAGWPRHPVFETIRKDAQGKAPYIGNIQSPGEYRGMHELPWPMVDEWSHVFRDMVNTGQQGVWVTTEILPDGWDHPLNMANWHAIQTYMRDPFADAAKIKREWAEQRFGVKAAPAIPDILDKVRESARGMYEFDALWNHKHSRLPWLEYFDCHVCGPYREMKRAKGMMGMNLPLDMYTASRAAEIKANPKTRMVFNSVPITPQLKAEAMAQKESAVQLMEQVIRQWGELKGTIPAGEHAKIAAGLEANRADTVVFRSLMDLFMDWKLGVLTSGRIDKVLAAARGLRGAVVQEPLLEISPENALRGGTLDRTPATLASVAGQLRRELRTPWVEEYWKAHPNGVS